MDGGYFGPNFPTHFLLYFPDLAYFKLPQKFTPKLFGFKIYGKEGSKYHHINLLKQEKKKLEEEVENLKLSPQINNKSNQTKDNKVNKNETEKENNEKELFN